MTIVRNQVRRSVWFHAAALAGLLLASAACENDDAGLVDGNLDGGGSKGGGNGSGDGSATGGGSGQGGGTSGQGGNAGQGGTAGAVGGAGGSKPLPSLGVGKPCNNDFQCEAGFICIDEEEGWPTTGYCTIDCEGDADCGGDAFCGPAFGDGVRVCFQTCTGNKCADAAHVCSQKLSGILDLGKLSCVPGKATARDGDACTGFADCRGSQVCLRNPFSIPTGMCLHVGCTPGDNSTCAATGDGACLAFGGTGLCLDTCSADTQCRQAEGHVCQENTVVASPGFCTYPHREPGQPCGTDRDCGPEPWECLKGPRFPNGYCAARGCTVGNENTCPLDSKCWDPNPNMINDLYCAATCETSLKCAPGYICETLAGIAPATKGCVIDPRL